MVRQLQPWFENYGKRQVRSPKIYFRDSGLLHLLLGARTEQELQSHPRSGASWEGFMLEQVLRLAQPDEAYFWATYTRAELDLLMLKCGRRIGVEFKRADAPALATISLYFENNVICLPPEHYCALAHASCVGIFVFATGAT